jgi:hypothetical protein
VYEWLSSALPLGTWARYLEMERAALQERANGGRNLGGMEAHRSGITESLHCEKRSSIEWRYR